MGGKRVNARIDMYFVTFLFQMSYLDDSLLWVWIALLCLPPVALVTWAASQHKAKAFERRIGCLLERVREEANKAYQSEENMNRVEGEERSDTRSDAMEAIPEGTEEDDSVKMESVNIQRWEELPVCVQHFLTNSVRDNRKFRAFKLRHIMKIRFGAGSKWREMSSAEEVVSPLVPAFMFTGKMDIGPGLFTRGYECLIDGSGEMNWKLRGAYTVAQGDGAIISKAARARWLSEAVCYPQALQPSRLLRWEGIGKGQDNQARAILEDDDFVVSSVFTFGRNGKVVEVQTDDYARVLHNGKIEQCSLYGKCNGHMLFGLTSPGRYPNQSSSATTGGVVIPTDLRMSLKGSDGIEWDAIHTTVASIRPE